MIFKIGWDIGGAHIKAAVIHQNKILSVYQVACPLWQGLDKLKQSVSFLKNQFTSYSQQKHAITMTGELVDLFANRNDGVEQIIKTMSDLLASQSIEIFCGSIGFLPVNEVQKNHYYFIASANWLASASFSAKQFPNCLFVDMGSTTTDIVLCEQGQVMAKGLTDYERLISQELIYCGIVRTPVMAIAQTVLDNQNVVGVMAEHFATMADVYRLTGELSENHDQTPTADGKEKTIEASARRLSRMLGDDFKLNEIERWRAVAQHIRAIQVQRIQKSCELRLVEKKFPIIGAGVGRFLVQKIAANLELPYIDFSTLYTEAQQLEFSAADCAPAVAVASLLTN